MLKFYRNLVVLIGLMMIFTAGAPIKADEAVRPEVRALWVDAFRDGFKTPAQVDRLIQDAVKANINTLIVQVRRRGDAYYNNSIEPRTEDPVLTTGFDALQYLIDKAHAKHLEVHAWLNTLVAWNSSVPPKDPNHVWNLHGPQAAGRANWVSYYRNLDPADPTGKNWLSELCPSYYLDPGHPDVLDYTVNVYLNVVKNYNVDGIHLDYSRYAGLGWGYNPTSLARYNARYGTTGMPAPDDPQWAEWRREQTANLMRKIYLKAIAIKPGLKVSSAVITWGDGPLNEDDWVNSRAYARVCQDWRGWLAEGIIDTAIPMNYFREWKPGEQVSYNRWIDWEKDHQYNRQIVIGPGIFEQYIEQSLDQIRRAQAPSSHGNYAAGVSLYAYGASNLYSDDDYKESTASLNLPRQPYRYAPETNIWLYGLLARNGGYRDQATDTYIPTQPVFPAPAPIPDMPWKSHPAKGYLMGIVVASDGMTNDHLKVSVDGLDTTHSQYTHSDAVNVHRAAYTDGSGWFGLAELPPGHYRVSVDREGFSSEKEHDVTVSPGRVAEICFK